MSLLTVCLLVQSAMCFKVSVTHTLTVSINLCKEWAKAYSLEELLSQKQEMIDKNQ